MRAFVRMRQMVTDARVAPTIQFKQKIDKLAEYVEDILNQNDIFYHAPKNLLTPVW